MGIFLLVIDLIVVTSEMARPQGAWPIKGNSKTSQALSPTFSFAAILRSGITAVNQVHDTHDASPRVEGLVPIVWIPDNLWLRVCLAIVGEKSLSRNSRQKLPVAVLSRGSFDDFQP
jgi:hypothetical protein